MGVPVVASDLPGVRVPVQKAGMGKIVPVRNSEKLAEAIVEVLINKEKLVNNHWCLNRWFSFVRLSCSGYTVHIVWTDFFLFCSTEG